MIHQSRITRLEVNLSAIVHNGRAIRSILSPFTRLMAIVKANAYGHGALPVAKALEEEVDAFGVAMVDEAVSLREGGITSPLHILGLTPKEEHGYLFQYHLIPTICRIDEVASLSKLALERGEEIGVNLKIDTGMGRIGLFPGDLQSFLGEMKMYPGVKIIGFMSHCSSADSDPSFTRKQYETFISCTKGQKPIKHLANSATLLKDPTYHLDMVRPGLSLYGLYPSKELKERGIITLQEPLTWKSRILHLKTLPPNSPISYGQTYLTTKKTKVDTIPLGYADGYLRQLSNKGEVLIRGERALVIGRICMDQFLVDVTAIEGVVLGDEVVLLGSQGKDFIGVDELAQGLKTINYEVVTGITNRVPRDYKGWRFFDGTSISPLAQEEDPC